MIDLKYIVREAAELLQAYEAEEDKNYIEGVIDLASALAFPLVPLAVSNALMKTALAEYEKGEW